MKKGLSLLVAMVVVVSQSLSFAADSAVVTAQNTMNALVEQQVSVGDAQDYILSHVSAAEAKRIAREFKVCQAAGSCKEDFAQIAASVKVQAATGSGFHGNGYNVLRNVAIAIGVAAVIYLVLNQPGAVFMSAGTGYYGTDVGYASF